MTTLQEIQNNAEYEKIEDNGTVRYVKKGQYIDVNSPTNNRNERQLVPYTEHEVIVQGGNIVSEQRYVKSPYEHGKWEKIVLQEKVN